MNPYILSCCSTADLPRDYFEKREIPYLCFHYSLDGEERTDDLGETLPFDEFYKKIRTVKSIRTSQPGVGEFVSYFRGFLARGLDILHVSLSTGISGEMNSAILARDLLKEEFPGQRIEIVDSLGASMGYGLLMDLLADRRDQGKSLDEVLAAALELRHHIQHWFFSTDLSFYFRGGRISRTAYLAGRMISICPLLHVDSQGKLVPVAKVRTKKRVIREMCRKMETYTQGGTGYAGKCFISHSDCYEDARALADQIEERFPSLDGAVQINYVGTTIGAHTGPGTVALFFAGEKR